MKLADRENALPAGQKRWEMYLERLGCSGLDTVVKVKEKLKEIKKNFKKDLEKTYMSLRKS